MAGFRKKGSTSSRRLLAGASKDPRALDILGTKANGGYGNGLATYRRQEDGFAYNLTETRNDVK